MSRIDHFHNPNAPVPNSIVPACTVVACNDQGSVLLIRRTDNNLWALPGGAMEFGESITRTAVREVEEETGIHVLITGLVGIYSDPNHLIEFSDGEVRQQFSICFTARPTGGSPTLSDESSDVRFIQPRCLDDLDIHPSMRLRIGHALAERSAPYLG